MYIKIELAGHQIQDAIAEYVLKTTGTKMADDVPPWIHCIDDKKRPKDLVDIDESIFCSLFIEAINQESQDNLSKQQNKSE
jgi:hypothetical protein